MLRLLKCALSLFAGAALVAALDGWFQPGADVAFFQRETIGFAIVGAWVVGAAMLLLATLIPAWRERLQPGGAFWLGLSLAAVPPAGAWLPWPWALIALLPGLLLARQAGAQALGKRLMPTPLAAVVVVAGAALVLSAPYLEPSRASLSPPDRDLAADPRPLPPDGPDVVLISIDTLRADALFGPTPADGGLAAPTPYLNQLRERALWADYALSSSNQTLPGHVGMLTGCDAMTHGVRSNLDFPDPELKLLSERFHDAGYATAGTIANALLSAATGMARGYDLFSDEPTALAAYGLILAEYLADRTWVGHLLPADSTRRQFQRWFFRRAMAVKDIPAAERVLDAALPQLQKLAANPRPFFAFIHFMDPHSAYRPPATMPGSGEPVRGVLSAALRPQVAARFLPAEGREIDLDLIRAVEEALLAGDEDAKVAAKYYHLVYLEEVMVVDHALAQVEAALKASGRPYVMLITADHGEQFGEHGLMEHANSLYEENLRVPFLLTGPLVTPGHLAQPPHLADVAPTLLWQAGLPIPEVMTGTPVDLALPPRPMVQVDQREIAVRDEAGLKWIGRWSEAGDDPAPSQLFNLAADEGEHHQLLAPTGLTPASLLPLIQGFLERDRWSTLQAANRTGAMQGAMLSQLGYADQADHR